MENFVKLKNVTVYFNPVTRQLKNKFLLISNSVTKSLDLKKGKHYTVNKDGTLEYNESGLEELFIAWLPFDSELKQLFVKSVADNETGNDARNIEDFLEDTILVDDSDNIILLTKIINYVTQYGNIDKKK